MAILRRNCPHCPAEHVAFELRWSEPFTVGVWNCSAVCGACRRPICFVAVRQSPHNNAPPNGHNGDIEPLWNVNEIWPTRTAPDSPPHTPGPVARRFLEGEDAFSRAKWNSAVAMYRSALDIAAKGMEGVEGGTFFARLAWLHEHHRITPDVRAWADVVRVEGNAALHDPEEFSEDDAKALRFFTEMFLRYVFELPGEVRDFREKVG